MLARDGQSTRSGSFAGNYTAIGWQLDERRQFAVAFGDLDQPTLQ
jgi:hypothetical protein